MKIFYIFLDIDGVMNDFTYWNKCKERNGNPKYMSMQNYPFNPDSLNNLMLLSKALLKYRAITRIVLSSTWRQDDESTAIVKSRLAEYGMTIYDKTPNINRLPLDKLNSHRSFEIKEWLQSNKNPTKYLVLDDDADIVNNFNEENYVNTDGTYGFNNEKLQEALKKVEVLYGKTSTD